MTDKTISTPDVFSESGDSRGVSNVIGTASLIVLALGLVGTMSVGLGGFADGLNSDLDGEITFQQDGGSISITVVSLSDAVSSLSIATDGGGDASDADAPDATAGSVAKVSGYSEDDTLTVTVSDGNGNSQVIAQFTVASDAP